MPKQPYIAFYIGDWKRDAQVNLCSPETRGIWFDFLCDMHDLQSGGKLTGDKDQLCRSGRCSHAQLDRAIAELADTRTADISERNGVYTIICRRLKKEAEISVSRAASGKLGGFRRGSKIQANCEGDIEAEIESCKWWKDADFQTAWDEWAEHRASIRKPITPLAKLKQIRELKSIGKARAIAAINLSILHQWQGIYEPKTNNANSNGKHYTDRPNPRNEGVIVGPTQYGSVKPRAQRELEEKRRLASQVDAHANHSPPVGTSPV